MLSYLDRAGYRVLLLQVVSEKKCIKKNVKKNITCYRVLLQVVLYYCFFPTHITFYLFTTHITTSLLLILLPPADSGDHAGSEVEGSDAQNTAGGGDNDTCCYEPLRQHMSHDLIAACVSRPHSSICPQNSIFTVRVSLQAA